MATITLNPPPTRLTRIRQALRSYWTGPLTSSSPEIIRLLADREPVASGVNVNADTALNFSAMWAAVNLIASDVGSLPLILYKRLQNGGKQRFEGSKLYKLLKDQPNPEMGAMVFRETVQSHILTTGNGYAEIERDLAGRPLALWPLTPTRVTPRRYGPDRELYYDVTNPDGSVSRIEAANILHIPGLGYDGVCGYSVVSRARESIGLGLATERFGAAFFGAGATFGGVVTHPKALTPTAKKNLEDSIEARHQGLSRAHRILVLEEAMTFAHTGVNPDDAQFLETRKFQVTEIARWFGIPPHKIGDLEKATFSNIEHLAIDYVTSCLRRWLIRWEQEINRKLIPASEQNIQFAEHLVDALLRGDVESRYRAYAVGRQWGWLSADDVREKENANPLPDGQGQIYLVPANMFAAKAYVDNPAPSATPPPAPAAATPDPEAGRAVEVLREVLKKAEDRAIILEGQLNDERNAVQVATEEAKRLRETGKGILSELAQAQTERDRAKQAAEEAQAEFGRLQEALTAANRSGEQASAELAETRKALEESRQQHERQGDELLSALEAFDKAEQAAAVALAVSERADLAAKKAEAEALAVAEDFGSNLIARGQAEQAAADARSEADTRAAELKQARAEVALLADAERLATDREAASLADLKALDAAYQQQLQELENLTQDYANLIATRDRLENALRVATGQRSTAEAEIVTAHMEHERLSTRLAEVEGALMSVQAESEQALEAERDRRLRHEAAVIASHRALIQDAVRRMIERETDRARRAQGSPEKLRAWADHFYPGHEETCYRTFLPALRVHCAWTGQYDQEDAQARALAARYVQESKRQIAAVVDGDADAIGASLFALCSRWESDRAAEVADTIFAEELAYLKRETKEG